MVTYRGYYVYLIDDGFLFSGYLFSSLQDIVDAIDCLEVA